MWHAACLPALGRKAIMWGDVTVTGSPYTVLGSLVRSSPVVCFLFSQSVQFASSRCCSLEHDSSPSFLFRQKSLEHMQAFLNHSEEFAIQLPFSSLSQSGFRLQRYTHNIRLILTGCLYCEDALPPPTALSIDTE